jgi:hypothetical protein
MMVAMKRTRAWWARLTGDERADLVGVERQLSRNSPYPPEDIEHELMLSEKRYWLIAKADGQLQDIDERELGFV